MILMNIDEDEKVVMHRPTKHSLVGLQGNTDYTFKDDSMKF